MYAARDGGLALVVVMSCTPLAMIARSLGGRWQRIRDGEAYQTIGTWFIGLAACLLAIPFLTDLVGFLEGDLLILCAAFMCVTGLILMLYGRCIARQQRRQLYLPDQEHGPR